MAKKFGQGVTDAQMRLARIISEKLDMSYSQAVKAFQRKDEKQIDEWKRQLQDKK